MTVDIIIPVYNVEAFLPRCLDSIKAQTYTDWRAICVDDGSNDACPQILDSYTSEDSRFTVIHKPNGGLSDARNTGLDHSDAEYIMFVDSDDFIHPQTLELALGLARRDESDVVSWYRDSLYRNIQIKLLRRLGRDDISAKPWRISRKYDISSVRSLVTDDILSCCSDWKHARQPFAVKHCWVWRHLFRREAIQGVRFLTGMNYEDIPWWSEVMLHIKRATITRLPLYYYYPNRKSISKTTDQLGKDIAGLKGLGHVYEIYKLHASEAQMDAWSHNIKWAILCRMFSKREITLSPEFEDLLRHLWDEGFFNDARQPEEIMAMHSIMHIRKTRSRLQSKNFFRTLAR